MTSLWPSSPEWICHCVALRSNVVLHESGDAIEQVYFPLSGMISLLAVMQSGEAIETGIVGADGLVGGGAAINGHAFGQRARDTRRCIGSCLSSVCVCVAVQSPAIWGSGLGPIAQV
jgi:hypothetical protein